MELLEGVNNILALVDIGGGIRLVWLSRRYGTPQLMIAGAMIMLVTFILAALALGPILDLVLGILMGLAG